MHSFFGESMLTIKLICVGKMKEKFYKDAYAEYAKRLSGYCRLELIELPESSLDKEADAVLKYTSTRMYVIAMAVEGKKISSEELAKKINNIALSGKSEISFIIGGSEGLADRVKNSADEKISMSDMTFPHHLARVMLSEQIYRAFKIIEGGTYHK